MKKKIITVAAILLVLCLVGFVVYWELSHGNRRLVDTKNRFDRAVLRLPNDEVVEGKLSSWLDYPDSDAVMVTIAGKTYMTHYENVCLIYD